MSPAHEEAPYFRAEPMHRFAQTQAAKEAKLEDKRRLARQTMWDRIHAEKASDEEAAMGTMFHYIDDLIAQGRIESCNSFLAMTDLDKLSDLLWIGLLTITFAARERLPARKSLYQSIFNRIAAAESKAKAIELLQGLE